MPTSPAAVHRKPYLSRKQLRKFLKKSSRQNGDYSSTEMATNIYNMKYLLSGRGNIQLNDHISKAVKYSHMYLFIGLFVCLSLFNNDPGKARFNEYHSEY